MIEPKFKIGQTVWVWNAGTNNFGEVFHIFDANHKMDSGHYGGVPIYVIGWDVPGIGDMVYEAREQHLVHEFQHCNGWDFRHVCKPQPDRVLNDLKKRLDYARAKLTNSECDALRAEEEITNLTTQIELLKTETPESPVP